MGCKGGELEGGARDLKMVHQCSLQLGTYMMFRGDHTYFQTITYTALNSPYSP